MTQTTVGSKTFSLFSLPTTPGFSDVQMSQTDCVSVVQSPYVPGQSRTQQWPGK